jgi:hypothetical protein
MGTGIKIRGTTATIYEPTAAYKSWRIVYVDKATGKRKTTSGGSNQEAAEAKARLVVGEAVDGRRLDDQPPTLQQAVDDWLAAHRSGWSSRTYDHYFFLSRKLTSLYGDRPLTAFTVADMGKVDVKGQSRGQQEKIRTLVRGIFGHTTWVSKDQTDRLARGILLSGSSGGKRNPRVSSNDIPSGRFVAAAVITAAHTLQDGPLSDYWSQTDPTTGEIRDLKLWQTPSGSGMVRPYEQRFLDGLPDEWTEKHRRGIPAHYGDPEGRRQAETLELASRYRQIALAIALGAGGGLRVGELLALRVRHFLTAEQVSTIHAKRKRLDTSMLSGIGIYEGRVEVTEQASQGSRGKVYISGTKGSSKGRTLDLPAFLPNWRGFGVATHRTQIAEVVPRFADRKVSLWTATEEESLLLWRAGFTPLGYLLWQRLTELFNDRAVRNLDWGHRTKPFRQLLLFPTRNRARVGRDGEPNVQADSGWNPSTQIVEGAGTYQAQSNWARLTNPLMDYVAEEMDEWPEHRTNIKGRKGWTHHGFRHWAVSSRIQAGVPLPIIAREMGHNDPSFTLERYGHVFDGRTNPGSSDY